MTALLGLTATAAYASLPDGVDTSHYQHGTSLDWSAVRNSGVRFAFLKATEGSTYTDPWFAADWTATNKVGIYRGAYHFARPSIGSADSQAKYFVSRIGTQKNAGTLPPVLDLEATGGLTAKQLITWTQKWLDTVEQLTGRTPIIYVSPAFWKYNMANSTAFHNYPLWIANYGVSSPTVPGGWPTWTFWQSTSTGRVSGISGNVDKDLFNGTLAQLQKFALIDSDPVATSVTLTPSITAPTTGQTVKFSGTLLDASSKPLSGKSVVLATRGAGTTTWTRIATATTSSTGGYAVKLPVTDAASYRTRFVADSNYAGSLSSIAKLSLTPLPTTLSLTATANDVLAGTSVTLSGSLAATTALANVPVTIERQLPGSNTWTTVQSVTTDDTGAFAVPTTMMTSAAYRATYAGTPAYTPATSTTQAITVTRATTSATMTVSNTAPYQGGQIVIRGTLTNDTTPVAGRTVTVVGQLAGTTTWTTVGTAKTDASGNYAVSTAVESAGTYRTDFAGDAYYLPTSSAAQDVTITPPMPTALSLRAPSDHLRKGSTMVLSGRLQTNAGAPVADRRVVLWKKVVGSTGDWYRVGHATTAADGSWQMSVAPPKSAKFRAEWRGGSKYAGSWSPVVRIDVR